MIKYVSIGLAALTATVLWFWLTPEPAIPEGYTTEFPVTESNTEVISDNQLLASSKNGEAIGFITPTESEMTQLTAGSRTFSPETSNSFEILYYEPEGRLVVSLLEEPLGNARAEAELYLQTTLGFTESELCNIRARVLTNRFVSNFYADQELGFSFCAGAVQLP